MGEPVRNPYPYLRVWVSAGTGAGQLKSARGSPMLITIRNQPDGDGVFAILRHTENYAQTTGP